MLMKALLLYSSHDGQTQSIASGIANEIQGTVKFDIRDLSQVDKVNLTDYQAVMIGASIRYGHFNSALNRFINQHIDQLNEMPSAFFSVNLTARKPEKRTSHTNAYTRKFLVKTPWKPTLCGVFAGALRYPRYRWFDRVMIQLIMRMTGGETDSSKEYEYTDWEQVKHFAQEFAHLKPQNGSMSTE